MRVGLSAGDVGSEEERPCGLGGVRAGKFRRSSRDGWGWDRA